jgi:hypothetical protein
MLALSKDAPLISNASLETLPRKGHILSIFGCWKLKTEDNKKCNKKREERQNE